MSLFLGCLAAAALLGLEHQFVILLRPHIFLPFVGLALPGDLVVSLAVVRTPNLRPGLALNLLDLGLFAAADVHLAVALKLVRFG